MSTSQIHKAGDEPASKKHHALIMLSILAWVGSLVAIDKILARASATDSMALLLIALNAAIGLVTIVIYMRFLTELDDLQKKIQLDALALAMGAGLVSAFSYSLLLTAGLVSEPGLAIVIMVMSGTYIVGLVAGRIRYR